MLLCLIGSLCAGKKTISQLLPNYQIIYIGKDNSLENEEKKMNWFNSAAEALEFVTVNWTKNWVVIIKCLEEWQIFSRRPFAFLVYVDAPIKLRYQRYVASRGFITLEEFIEKQDDQTTSSDLLHLFSFSKLFIENSFTETKDLASHLTTLNLENNEIVRPNWDEYFMGLAKLAATRSNCMKRSVAAILVKNNRIVSTGYNGTASNTRNCMDGGCSRCNSNAPCGSSLDECLCLHAEENALLEAGRDRANGAVMYVTSCPCLGCAKKIAQVGISQVVYDQSYSVDTSSAKVLNEANVKIRKFTSLSDKMKELRIN